MQNSPGPRITRAESRQPISESCVLSARLSRSSRQMSQTEIATQVISAQSRDRAVLAGVALSSFAALLLELALTRLFSVVLFYHFAFLAISIALLGLGAGGVFAYLAKARLAKYPTRSFASALCTANSLVVVAVLEVVLHVPVALNVSQLNFLYLKE